MAAAGEAANEKARPRPGGRPRDAALDEAIILATRERLVRDGYSLMTIGDIAAEAKVSRPTLYRRWRTKFELVSWATSPAKRSARPSCSASSGSTPSNRGSRWSRTS
ncbi:helix-turn-helix domain-containing protein [Amycolatopsis sp. NPDC026612]|uniref:helix-turn-helix domain-containing protein n=1 Tax=Amycolatopsis sp. NPDC026612 TaxID=3155466 RepID=UPI0033ED8BF9